MIRSRRAARSGRVLCVLAVAVAVTGSLLVACAPVDTNRMQPASVEQQVLIYPNVEVTDNIAYGPGAFQRVDVCQPADAEISALNNGPRRAVISVHGGSWRKGDKASTQWRSVCEWLASEGFIAFSANYSLAPLAPYPAGIDDIRTLVRWLRHPLQVTTYGYDPSLIGALGGSAGGNLVAQLGVEGTGAWDVGTRVAAVVELSAPIDLTAAMADGYSQKFQQIQLDYLGCDNYDDCPSAREASPVYAVDPSDPPFFVGHSRNEFVPVEQAKVLVSALEANGIDTSYAEAPGKKHSIAMLDDTLRAQIAEFLHTHL